MSKIKYKDKVGALFAIAMCRKAGKKGNPNRREKRAYFENGSWYVTSKKQKTDSHITPMTTEEKANFDTMMRGAQETMENARRQRAIDAFNAERESANAILI